MKPLMVGTILPTAESWRRERDHAAKMERRKRARERALALPGDVKDTGLERQFHAGGVYRVVGNDGRVRVFEKRADGDYFMRFE